MLRSRGDRLGLTMIAASLLVIAVVTALSVRHHGDSRRAQIRVRGGELTRLLAHLPFTQLSDPKSGSDLLRLLQRAGDDRELAYSAVVDPSGQPLVAVPAPGVAIPALSFAGEPSAWLSEHLLPAADGSAHYREYSAPLFDAGKRVGYVRVGFFEPALALGSQEVRLFALVALLVFLLTPAFYFLLRREIRPISEVNQQIQRALDEEQLHPMEIRASGELADFIQRFNGLMRMAGDRMARLESSHRKVLTTSKVLSYQKSRIESVLQALPDPAIVLDESGAPTFANAKWEGLLGVTLAEVRDQQSREWCREPELLAFLSRYSSLGARPHRVEAVEFVPTSAPDKKLRVSGFPLFSPKNANEIFGALVVCSDVTQEDLARRARSEFVGHVAHELKSPLNVLGMYAEQLSGEAGASEEFRIEAVNVITDEVDRLATLINNLLNLTQIEMGSIALNRQRVKLGDLLRDLLDTVSRSGRVTGLRFQLEVPPDLSPVSVDKELFRVAVTNLLTNAVKYNRPGGSVILGAEETETELRIRVKDEGIGISAEDQAHIFEHFYRSNDREVRNRTGHGLGLALTKNIAEIHHGTVEVQSSPGTGSEFTFVLTKHVGLVQQAI